MSRQIEAEIAARLDQILLERAAAERKDRRAFEILLGRRIRQVRKVDVAISQIEAARQIGVSHQCFVKIEAGKITRRSERLVYAWLAASIRSTNTKGATKL